MPSLTMKTMNFYLGCFLLIISKLAQAFSCQDPQVIHQWPIHFDKQRLALTQAYQRTHYGINTTTIEPKMIVLHWTSFPNLAAIWRMFNKNILASERRDKLPGDLNVSIHFIVDKDGSIYQLMPENIMARHVIGLNHYAIGIENIGGVDNQDDLTTAQVQANAFLVCYLKRKYPQIRYLIGHNEYARYRNTNLWLEKDKNYITDKIDPGPTFLSEVKKLIKQ